MLVAGEKRWSNAGRMSAHADRSGETAPAPMKEDLPKPYLTAAGDLVIPMLSDPKYHWWKPGGQPVRKTREELGGKR
jgi:hypothetical protein